MAKEYIAVLGDVVGSRALAARPRARLQRRLREVLAEVNRRWRREIAARFAIALGDQFEGLLHTAAPLWELSHWVRAELPEVDWIVAAGRGPVSTPLARTATEVDGPCFHQARSALDAANACFTPLPARLRRNHHTGVVDERLPDDDYGSGTFEGIRSQDILPLLTDRLDPVDVHRRNCFLWRLVNQAYNGNYDMSDPEDVARLQGFVLAELAHFRDGGRPTELHGVFRKRLL